MPFEIVRNDITRMRVDAIVNAANRTLLGGGGVDGAIHAAAGPELLEECRQLHGCETGQAKITNGYRLPARYVIHTVGPIWQGGSCHERELLLSCYRNSLALAAEKECESIAFPLISAGAYGYPKEEAMEVAVEAISAFLLRHEMMVYLVVFGRQALFTGRKLFRDVREYIDENYVESHAGRDAERRRSNLWRRDEIKATVLEEELLADAMMEASPNLPAEPMAAPMGRPVPKTYGARPREEEETEAPRKLPRIDWKNLIRDTDESFSQMLLRLIDEKGLTDVQCYKKANVDRRLFSKIRSDPDYHPSKPTVFAFAVALRLTLPETKEFLKKAGFALTHSSKLDVVLEYCIKQQCYDVLEINEVLYELDLPLLGNSGSAA